MRAVVDTRSLLAFRAGTVARRRRWVLLGAFLGLTALAIGGPASLPHAGVTGDPNARAIDVLTLLPSAYAVFLLLNVVSGVASGGGRELVPREQLVAYPVGPITDHLGALLLAPLNIAWLLESWLLLGSSAYGVGWSHRLLPLLLASALWILAATAIGQVIAWAVEAVRCTPPGLWIVRGLGLVVVAAGAVLQVSGRLSSWADRVPTRWIVLRSAFGWSERELSTLVVLLAMLLAAVVLGAVPATIAGRMLARDEQRAESGVHSSRPLVASDFRMLLRIDRGGIWRAVPMRRGLAVLAISPGLIALAGALPWSELTIFPGLVASGGVLLFGVNAWCLDERGGLWRESLPVDPAIVFAARAWALTEFLLLASAVTLLIGSFRAGSADPGEIAAVLTAWIVVTVQVVAAALRWSQRSPYPVDLRSARATPAPPMVMVGYSARLALGTTVTALAFEGLGRLGVWYAAPLIGCAALCWYGVRLLRLRDSWSDPVVRAQVITAVAL